MIRNRFKRCVQRHEWLATDWYFLWGFVGSFLSKPCSILNISLLKTSYCSTYWSKILILYNSGFYHVMHTYFDASGRNWGTAVLAKSSSFLCCNAKWIALWLLSFEGPSLWLYTAKLLLKMLLTVCCPIIQYCVFNCYFKASQDFQASSHFVWYDARDIYCEMYIFGSTLLGTFWGYLILIKSVFLRGKRRQGGKECSKR